MDAIPSESRPTSDAPAPRSVVWMYVVFVVSGFAALLYQVIWQRTLFAIFGINIESVTVVVTAFMLGLGIGSFVGGQISKKASRPLLLVFAAVEASIGAFGIVSLRLFKALGILALAWSPGATAVLTFGLVLLPTTLMGATLPLLVAYAVSRSGNVGRSVGILYFVNTLGSALASFVAVLLFLPKLALSGTTTFAVVLNFAVAAIVAVVHVKKAAS